MINVCVACMYVYVYAFEMNRAADDCTLHSSMHRPEPAWTNRETYITYYTLHSVSIRCLCNGNAY